MRLLQYKSLFVNPIKRMSDNLWKHLEDPVVRVAVFEDNFPLFFLYHYGWAELTDFHMAWMESLQSKNDTMIV